MKKVKDKTFPTQNGFRPASTVSSYSLILLVNKWVTTFLFMNSWKWHLIAFTLNLSVFVFNSSCYRKAWLKIIKCKSNFDIEAFFLLYF